MLQESRYSYEWRNENNLDPGRLQFMVKIKSPSASKTFIHGIT